MATLTRRLRRLLLSSLLVAVAGVGGGFATPELSTVQGTSICVMVLGITVALGSLIALRAARAWQTDANPRLSGLALAISSPDVSASATKRQRSIRAAAAVVLT